MRRRQFLERAIKVGAAGLCAVEAGCSRQRRTVDFQVEGFTCVTCAAGLETLLGRERGVLGVTATYPEGRAHVTFDPHATAVETLEGVIRAMGFRPSVLAQG